MVPIALGESTAAHQRRIESHTMFRERLLVTLKALHASRCIRASQVSNFAMAEIDQMFGREEADFDIVGGNGARAHAFKLSIDQDDAPVFANGTPQKLSIMRRG